MKEYSRKIISFVLAFLVLLSTFSFTVEKHYCGDFLVDVSFVGNANDCGMKMKQKTTDKVKKKCCKDEYHQLEGQKELQKEKGVHLDFLKQQFLTSFCLSSRHLYTQINFVEKSNFYEPPPDILKINYQVYYQSFLI